MAHRYTLGVDVGTYETKGALVGEDGAVVASTARPHDLSVPRAGRAEHDAERDWWGDLVAVTRELLDASGVDPSAIAAVACSAIGPCMLPVDPDGNPLRPAILYGIDTRAHEEIRELTERIGDATLLERCGNTLTTQSVGPKILWLKRHEPDVYREAAHFVTSTTFLVRRLTGATVTDHYSAASFTPLYDPREERWAPDLAEGIVETERLGELGWTTDVAGRITAEAGRATGLAEGTPVIVGTIDAAAEAVSGGVTRPGQMMLMYGTTLFLIQVVAERRRDPRLWSAPYLFPGTHALMAGMSTTGALTRWLRDNFARELVREEEGGGGNAYAALAEEAAAVEAGSDGLVFLPYLSGERTPINDPGAKGVLFGLTLAHRRAHVYRAALEGVGYGIRHHLDVLEEIGAEPSELVAVGGGTKNEAWLQIVSDVCGRPQTVPAVTLGAAYGDAFLASLGVSGERDLSGIDRWVRADRRLEPSPDRHASYGPLYRVYRELYERTKGLMHELPG